MVKLGGRGKNIGQPKQEFEIASYLYFVSAFTWFGCRHMMYEIASYLKFWRKVQGIHIVSMSIVLVCVHKHDFRLK